MKNFHLILAWNVLVLLGTGSCGTRISLSALKADLDYLRDYWLQNPGERDRQGRILFPNNSQILVRFGAHPNGEFIRNEAWTKDSQEFRKDAVQLINIHKMYSRDSTFNEPYYKHGTFYMPNREMNNVTEPLLETGYWVEMLPIKNDDLYKPSVEIQYIELNTLSNDIEREIAKMDSRNKSVTLEYGPNEFSVEFTKGDPFVLLRFVRVLEYEDISYESESTDANFEFSIPYYYLTYDQRTKLFGSVLSDQVNGRSVVRSNVGTNYVLKDGVVSKEREDATDKV